MSRHRTIDDDVVVESVKQQVIGRGDGTYDCGAISCDGDHRYQIAPGETDTVFLDVSAPRHQPRDYTIKRVYCAECKDEAGLTVESANSNEAAVRATLRRDSASEPAYVRDADVLETSPVGKGGI